MFTRPGWQDQLLITTNIDSDGNRFFFNELGKFQNGTWYSFVISQKKETVGDFLNNLIFFEISIQSLNYYFDVTINGTWKVHIKNNNARNFTNVKIYAGDMYHEAADAEIRNFYACQLSNTGKVKFDLLIVNNF